MISITSHVPEWKQWRTMTLSTLLKLYTWTELEFLGKTKQLRTAYLVDDPNPELRRGYQLRLRLFSDDQKQEEILYVRVSKRLYLATKEIGSATLVWYQPSRHSKRKGRIMLARCKGW